MSLEITNLNKSYKDRIIFENFNISFKLNKINCILGKSGCGKSTLLNIISGILKSDDKKNNTINKSELSYIFQEDRLIEWISIEENIKLVGKKYYNKIQLNEITNKYLDIVGISEYSKQYPQMLSGGIRQRANIARAFVNPSKYILMDEPFKSIDIKNKYEIMKELKELIKNENKTIIFVTHDIDEAIFLSDYIFILGGSPIRIKETFSNIEKSKKEDIIKFI